MSNRVVHFEIQSADPEKAAKFYKDIFGWEINEWKMPGVELPDENRYWMVMTAPEEGKEPGINGGLMLRKGEVPEDGCSVNAFVCTINVDSVDEHAEKISAAGGIVAVPKMAISTIEWLAYLKDLDGNIFGIMEEDKEAK
jgi:uncharacterized protein